MMDCYLPRHERLPNDVKLLANENFPLQSVFYLKDKDFDIRAIGIDNPSVKDETVITFATDEDRTIITFDRDYGELIFRNNYKPPCGVIYLRLDQYSPTKPGEIIELMLLDNSIDFRNALTVVDKNGIRQRKY
jgi:predicted nuclease of predicted toxin-antitoxin system